MDRIRSAIKEKFAVTRWRDAQVALEQSGQSDSRASELATAFGLDLRPKGKQESADFPYLYPSEVLNLRLIGAGIIGYGGHLVADISLCLLLAMKERDKELTVYYIQRRAAITVEIWQTALLWGSCTIYDYLLQYGDADYLTRCNRICADTVFVDHLIERYQRCSMLPYLHWLLRLIGGHLTIEQIDSLELPRVQLTHCLKGMEAPLMKAASEHWGIRLTPYLAGMTDDPKIYWQHVPTELWTKRLEVIDPEKIEVTDTIFFHRDEQGLILPIPARMSSQIDELRRLYTETAIQVFAGICDRKQQSPLEVRGLVVANMEHFPRPQVIGNASWRPISWYRDVIYQGRQNSASGRILTGESFDLDYAREITLASALQEPKFEFLLELERDGPVNYAKIIAKARIPIIAEWGFRRMTEQKISIENYVNGIDLGRTDSYYNDLARVHYQWYPSAPYLRL